MPALEPAEGVARVVWTGTFGNSTWANVWHVVRRDLTASAYRTDDWSDVEVQAMAVLARTLWNNHMRGLSNTSVVLTSTTVTDLTDETGAVGADLTNVTGLLSGSQHPASVSLCISWRESLHYRGGHPRTYLPPATVAQQATSTQWTTTHVTNSETAANALLVALRNDVTVDPNGLEMAGLHRFRNHATLVPPQVTFINSALVDNRMDSQRRRLGPDV